MGLTLREYIKKKAFAYLGLTQVDINPNTIKSDNSFINDPRDAQKLLLQEYNVWYAGNSEGLLNFYTKNDIVDYNYEPYFWRNKLSYFWSVSATEDDVKRSHSGQPRNIVDTLVNIVGMPQLSAGDDGDKDDIINKNLKKILRDNNFKRMFTQTQLPLTLVEGWGCYKINYDKTFRDTPILEYYRAEGCDFIYKGNQLIAIIFKNYYVDEKCKQYLLTEIRRIEVREYSTADGSKAKGPCLIIEKELFKLLTNDALEPVPLKKLPQLKDTESRLCITNYNGFLAVPCIIYDDVEGINPGRSIFTGKIDLFDDLDQCLSQSANTVRRSTPIEMINTNYLERDEHTGMPIMPTAFDRKYVTFNGGASADGSSSGQDSFMVTQPALDFTQYDAEAQHILMEIISGIMSPATLGIDISKKDNAEAQREKEKVTIFTRNTIIAEETEILRKLCNELLCANQLMNQGKITARGEESTVKFDEFADESLEAKAETLLMLFNAGVISPEMFMDKMYKDELNKDAYERELGYIKEQQQMSQMLPNMMGGFGQMGADNAYNDAMTAPENSINDFMPVGQ